MQSVQQESKVSEHTSKACIFCKIINRDIPCAKIYEDEKILSFLDIAPANKGHALVMPKQHYETLLDVPEPIVDDIMRIVKKVGRAISSAVGNEGFNVLINNKKVAGQLVPHLHVHLIPRFHNDGISLNWRPNRYNDKEIDEFAERIKKFL